ncbi:MAG: histidine kinase [Chryseobacterium sp.]|uniref:sensor histidine kinase n=1 Tax=Chryseobacterium sp. TaxID=1871047 RepID=UPI0025C4042F|nr:histidine kinase [Chryseobacterium sp.]MCJ7934613.1 histidine kinase [Chryseobacterium sp.]
MKLLDGIISLHQRHHIASHILFWVGIYMFSIVSENYTEHENLLSFSRAVFLGLTLITQIITAYFLAYFIIPMLFNTEKYGVVVLYFIVGMYIICVVSRMINIYIHEPLVGISPKPYENLTEIFTNIKKLFFIYFIRNISVALVFLFVKLLIDQFEMQKLTLTLAKDKAETELKHLKTQLNPHFLFNTLNNIYSLSLSSSQSASPAIARLSHLLDYILYRCDQPFVPLSSEIELLQNYIELERLRYGDHLELNFETDTPDEIEIAPLVLLSIVENAFKHGVSNDLNSSYIHIKAIQNNSVFEFEVENSVPLSIDQKIDKKNKGIGLVNLKQRLELIYGENYQLIIEDQKEKFKVTLILRSPLDQNVIYT